MPSRPTSSPSGLPYAVGAYTIWGLVLPLYLILVRHVPAFEFVGWRVIFTAPICLAALYWGGLWDELRDLLCNPRMLALLAASSLLIFINWLIYTAAIQQGHVLAASLGYYINPLANVLAGTLFFKERLSSRQWGAVGLAALGVSLLAWGAADTLLISLSLAATFCGYGLLRKLIPVSAMVGLSMETAILLLPAMGIVIWYGGSAWGQSGWSGNLLLALSGPLTASALLMFTTAARRMDYSALGFVQFLSPSFAFILALAVFHEPLRPVQLACFILIWCAIALFSWDLWQRRSASRASARHETAPAE